MAELDKKRLALFMDGTWNVVENNTNVWRMYSLCAKNSAVDGRHQICYYTKGLGTTYGERIRGGWFGSGINEAIIVAYQWLIENYNAGDEIFIFGFSRGAYTARSLAGLITTCGVLRPGSPIGVGELFAHQQKGDTKSIFDLNNDQRSGQQGKLSTLEGWMLDYSTEAQVAMVGVWDTVGSLKGQRGYFATGLRVPILNGFHALAIDEHRATFKPTLWTINNYLDKPAKDWRHRDLLHVEQRWFVGAHANVGGGYNSDLLPQLPLVWIMKKASSLNLTFKEEIKADERVYTSRVNNSFKEFAWGIYYYLARQGRAYYRPIGIPRQQSGQTVTEIVNETIDRSVFERWRRDPNYRPKNLLDWAKARNIDPAILKTSVRATDASDEVSDENWEHP